VFHKKLADVKLRKTHDPTITEKCDSSLMTSYQDDGLGMQDQSLGLRGHPTLNQYTYSSVDVKEDVCIPPLLRTVNELKKRISETAASVNDRMVRGTW
jgi:hypothetical protein